MARSLRIDEPDGWHHVMNRGVDHRLVFHGDIDRYTFERLLGEIRLEFGVEVHAYCLMGNHYHLVVHCPSGGLSASMQRLSSSYTRIVNERLGRDGPLFRGRFHSVPITTDDQLVNTVIYVHRNAVDVVQREALVAYRWSSLGPYLQRRAAPSWLSTEHVQSMLDSTDHRDMVMAGFDVSAEAVERILGDQVGLDPSTERAARLILLIEVADLPVDVIIEHLEMRSCGAVRTALARARQRRRVDAGFAATVADLTKRLRAAVTMVSDTIVTAAEWGSVACGDGTHRPGPDRSTSDRTRRGVPGT